MYDFATRFRAHSGGSGVQLRRFCGRCRAWRELLGTGHPALQPLAIAVALCCLASPARAPSVQRVKPCVFCKDGSRDSGRSPEQGRQLENVGRHFKALRQARGASAHLCRPSLAREAGHGCLTRQTTHGKTEMIRSGCVWMRWIRTAARIHPTQAGNFFATSWQSVENLDCCEDTVREGSARRRAAMPVQGPEAAGAEEGWRRFGRCRAGDEACVRGRSRRTSW